MKSLLRLGLVFCIGLALGIASPANADLPQKGDIAFAVSQGTPPSTLLLRGPANGMGMDVNAIWDQEPFIGGLIFDNLNMLPHNAQGNLLGVNFGSVAMGCSPCGGQLYNYSTTDDTVNAGQLFANTTGMGGTLTQTRWAGLSVSPDNSKIALNGYDAGNIIVFDYTAGDTKGAGAAASGGRETAPLTMIASDTQVTDWLDDNTVVAMTSFGVVKEINATTMAVMDQTTIPVPLVGSDNSAVLYEPSVSPYVWAMYSGFSGTTTNMLYVLDPQNGYSIEHQVDLSTSMATLRNMAFDEDGNLFMSGFGSMIGVIEDAAANALTIADNSSTMWYDGSMNTFASFPNLDVALSGGPTTAPCDFDASGTCDIDDIDELIMALVAGSTDLKYDLNGDNMVTLLDRDVWLAEAGAMNLMSMNGYLLGDANLDGAVDGTDFLIWNANKFTFPVETGKWSLGDFNADGFTDGTDFLIWNGNKFINVGPRPVPEPTGLVLVLLSGLAAAVLRRR